MMMKIAELEDRADRKRNAKDPAVLPCAYRNSDRNRMELLERVIDLSSDAIFVVDEQFRFAYANETASRLLGYCREALLTMTPLDIDAREPSEVSTEIRRMFEGDFAGVIESRYRHSDGRVFPVEVSVSCIEHAAARFGVYGVRDITERKRMEKLLHDREVLLHKRDQEFHTLVENSPDTIARYDRDCRRLYANPRLIADMGGDITRVLGTTPGQFPGGSSAARYETTLRDIIEHGEPRNFELRWQSAGAEKCTLVRMSPEFSASGEVTHVLAVGRDITEIDQYRRKIQRQAYYDSLTGLPNRALLFERLARLTSDTARRDECRFALMLLDLDNFKEINDALGHGAGDRVLCEAAKRMSDCVGDAGTVARLGGDEFSVLVSCSEHSAASTAIAEKILNELAKPFAIDGQELFVTGSIGIARYPEDGTDVDALYKFADTAMYQAKRMGRNNLQFYERAWTARSVSRMELEAALRKARQNGELVLYYQPQIDLLTGRMTGAEALLRWHRPNHGVVTPDHFISVAEEAGLIVDIGESVLRTACAAVAEWNRHRNLSIKMAVNLSARQFARNDLAGSIRGILAETGCMPEWLKLEITESLLLEDNSEVASTLATLQAMGVSFSIDDFGTGYSALSYLHRFPVSQIKIDRSFVRNMLDQRDKRELVRAMLSIASALDLESVAEGVETQAQANYLTENGCKLAQGYFFSQPMRREAFEDLLSAQDALAMDGSVDD